VSFLTLLLALQGGPQLIVKPAIRISRLNIGNLCKGERRCFGRKNGRTMERRELYPTLSVAGRENGHASPPISSS